LEQIANDPNYLHFYLSSFLHFSFVMKFVCQHMRNNSLYNPQDKDKKGIKVLRCSEWTYELRQDENLLVISPFFTQTGLFDAQNLYRILWYFVCLKAKNRLEEWCTCVIVMTILCPIFPEVFSIVTCSFYVRRLARLETTLFARRWKYFTGIAQWAHAVCV